MRRKAWRVTIAVAALIALLAGAALGAVAEDGEAAPYVENEWNFVDGSMDATRGIPADAVGALARIRDAGVLRVATEPYYPPQEFIDPDLSGQDSYVGSDMELARLIAERMGVELEIVPMEFSEVLNAVREGRCDLAISGLSFTPGRAATVEMSKGYNYGGENSGSVLLIRGEDRNAIKSIDDLAGRDVVAQSGSLQEMLMAENVLHYHQFRRLSQMQDVYDAVSSGLADAAMADAQAARVYIVNNLGCGLAVMPGLRFQLDEAFDGDRVAGKKGELQMMYFINGIIDELLQSGQYREWYERYAARAAELGM